MLKVVALQNFRSYKKTSFDFSQSVIIIGPNTVGKSNIIESIYLLSAGKSFRAERDAQMVHFGNEMGRVKSTVGDIQLEVVVTVGEVAGVKTQYKRFFVNGVARRRADFVGNLPSVLFSPKDLELVIGSPGLRREFLDHVLEQTDSQYRIALLGYTKGIKQRNALLDLAKETGRRSDKEFAYWDSLVIRNGQVITRKRQEFVEYLNVSKKDIFDFKIEYDISVISSERLAQYKEAEMSAGNTLVGPHRDDFKILFENPSAGSGQVELKSYGSRGQQRLGVLQLKILELDYIKSKVENDVILLLDDVFSELDEGHINLILDKIGEVQTIITTTHEEFIPAKIMKEMEIIELGSS